MLNSSYSVTTESKNEDHQNTTGLCRLEPYRGASSGISVHVEDYLNQLRFEVELEEKSVFAWADTYSIEVFYSLLSMNATHHATYLLQSLVDHHNAITVKGTIIKKSNQICR